ncbi:CHAT domain-containing protein [Pararoseomonas indoligenes]|uniref:CHAT domain-containing protein n=1 Tax=Roseomonas indoligenes TaxID=2820811 RepID=A0A940S320_9PROT|nr:CHAT domain-containing tetratricopeptide repeat protein [Pararoseomonas indoligenes]MBP0491771.1 CHAT domain-containing protein [Pararoseomonas indoligenes]
MRPATARPPLRALLLAPALVLGACTAPPPSAYVPSSSASTGAVSLGRNAAGEECRMAATGGGADVWCGEWSSPSARLREVPASPPLQAAEAARAGASARLDCAAPRGSAVLGDMPAALADCRRRAGGWPGFILAATSGSRSWVAEGVLPGYAAAEQALGVLSGRVPADAAPPSSAALDAMAARLAREAFSSGDIGRYEGLMAVGRDANQAERFVAAETAYRAALALQERALGPNSPDRFQPMVLLAIQLSNQGRFPEAEALFTRAAPLVPRAADPLAGAVLAHYRGLHEANRGRTEPALALLSGSYDTYSRVAPPEARSGARSGARLGAASSLVVDPMAARALIGMVETRRNAASVLRAAGRNAEAERASEDAARLAAAAGNPVGEDVIQARLARTGGAVEVAAGDSAGADASFGRASLRFARGVPRSRPLADTLLLRAANASSSAAAGFCREAVAILRTLREGTSSERIAPCIDALAAPGTQEALSEAFEAAQVAQGGVTATQIATAAARLTAGARNPAVADALRRREAADRALTISYRERDAAVEGGRTDLAALNARIAEAESTAAEADGAAQAAAPGYAQLVQSVASAREVLAALAPGEALVATTLPETRRGWTFVLLDSAITATRVGADSRTVDALVGRVRASVEAGDGKKPFAAGDAHALYAAVLGGSAPVLERATALVAAPEGSLLSIPYGIFVTAPPPRADSQEGAAFLLAKMPISHVPAPASLVSLRRAGRSGAPRPWFGFGDPRPVPASFAARSFPAAPECGRGLASLSRLPATALELAAAAQVSGASPGDRRMGGEFTAAAVRGVRLRDYRVLHFATHGVLPSDLACLTEPAIVASAAANGPDATQALLTSGVVLDLDLDADLVVLSACNSGGGAAAGESLSTLARAFFFSGARGLMVTHWYVNDVAAARVAAFTLQNIREGAAPADALRKAQLDLMRVPGASHPGLWAPFALIGPGPGPGAPVRSAAATPGTAG